MSSVKRWLLIEWCLEIQIVGGQAVEKGAKCENGDERRYKRCWKIESVQRYPDEKEETGLLSKEAINMVEI